MFWNYQVNPVGALMLLSSPLLIVLAHAMNRSGKERDAKVFAWYLVAVAIYAFGCAFEVMSPDLAVAVFWARFQYVGLSFMPFLLLLFTFRHFSISFNNRRIVEYMLFFTSALVLVLQQTHHVQPWYYHDPKIEIVNGITILTFAKGPVYLVFQLYQSVAVLSLMIHTVSRWKEGSPWFRSQAVVWLAGSGLPALVFALYQFDLTPFGLDLIPLAFSCSALLFFFALQRSLLLGPSPLASWSVFEAMSDGCIILDAFDRIVSFNAAAARYFPTLDGTAIGRYAIDCLASCRSLNDVLMLPGELRSSGSRVLECDESPGDRHFTVHVDPIGFHGKSGCSLLISNTTERHHQKILLEQANVRLEFQKQRLAELNTIKDMVLRVVSHDMKNPMSVLRNMVFLIRDPSIHGDKQKLDAMLDETLSCLDSTDLLLKNLFALGSQADGMLVARSDLVSVETLLKTVVKSALLDAQKKGIALYMEMEQDVIVLGDEYLLQPVLRNLVGNAIKFTPPGGTVVLGATITASQCQISVHDTGVGFQPSVLRAFGNNNPTVSTLGTDGERGTGLGLSACRFFLQLHGSTLDIGSVQGNGTCVSFVLPRYVRR